MNIRDIFARQKTNRERMDAATNPQQSDPLAPPVTILSDAQEPTVDEAFAEGMIRMVAEIGTGLWRMRQKLVKPGTDEPIEEMRRVYRHFESVWDSIVQAGAEIQDHTHNLYGSGTTLRVIAFQPTVGVDREIVTETLKPTIYFKGRLIQMGEVIVATPEA
jgi:hypothetical protein